MIANSNSRRLERMDRGRAPSPSWYLRSVVNLNSEPEQGRRFLTRPSRQGTSAALVQPGALRGGEWKLLPRVLCHVFTMGEFSKIARVTRRLLRHYREIGHIAGRRDVPGAGLVQINGQT